MSTAGSLAQFGADGTSAIATPLARPEAMTFDSAGERFFVADTGNGVVRSVSQETGVMRVVAGSLTSQDEPSATPMPATEVALKRPAGLAMDPTSNQLFISDTERGELLCLDFNQEPNTLSVVLGPNENLERPAALAFHQFGPGGQRVLFLLDRGGRGSQGQAAARPQLRIVDLGNPVLHTVIDPGFDFRILYDMALRELSTGDIELLVVADVGEDFAEEQFVFAPPDIDADFNFETDCYDGQDGDGDGLFDAEDPDCDDPLKIQVLRFEFLASGIPIQQGTAIVNTPTPILRCYKRFPIVSVIFDPGCRPGPPTAVESQNINFQEVVIEAISVDDRGRIYFVDTAENTIRFVELDANDNIVATGIVAGIDSPLAPPFDGSDPRLTRLSRLLDIHMDGLGHLYLVDTVNNRIRRTWLGDILKQT